VVYLALSSSRRHVLIIILRLVGLQLFVFSCRPTVLIAVLRPRSSLLSGSDYTLWRLSANNKGDVTYSQLQLASVGDRMNAVERNKTTVKKGCV